MTTTEIITMIENGKWNGKFYGNSIYVNNEKIECNKEELLNAILKSDYLKSDKQTRTSVFVTIAKRERINLPSLIKENKDVRIPFDKFANGEGLDYLYDFFNFITPIKKEMFFYANFINMIDGSYKGF